MRTLHSENKPSSLFMDKEHRNIDSQEVWSNSLSKAHSTEAMSSLNEVVSSFKAPIRFAFAYGSAVFRQTNQPMSDGLVDFVFAVNHPEHWHWLNIQQNAHHYSFLKYFGSRAIANIQTSYGAGIYYNAYVNINGIVCNFLNYQKLKYGVISIDDLKSDLKNWNTLYISGRMHKPVIDYFNIQIRVIRDDTLISDAQKQNLSHALNVALLILPAEFSERQLFTKIAQISYFGDFRMAIAENPNKIINIVSQQHREFRAIYERLIDVSPHVSYMRGAYLAQDLSAKSRLEIIKSLPENLKKRLLTLYDPQHEEQNVDQVIQQLSSSPNLKQMVAKAVKDIVFGPSVTQSLKGLYTGGILNSMHYSWRKIKKRFY